MHVKAFLEANPFSLGFGAINSNAVLQWITPGIVSAVLVANSPQLLLSSLYFAYNGLWTYMLLTDEWASYARKRKPLRVTSPTSIQRSTYRLQLPYRYGIPLMVMSGVLHWLVSQSIFLVDLEAYNDAGIRDPDGDLVTCGYSPVAMLTVIITGTLVLGVAIANGCRRYRLDGIPLAGSCSAAISAACHPPPGDDEASRKMVKWGVCETDPTADWRKVIDPTKQYNDGTGMRTSEDGVMTVGHCSFTSFAVERPVEGEPYAGLPSNLERCTVQCTGQLRKKHQNVVFDPILQITNRKLNIKRLETNAYQ